MRIAYFDCFSGISGDMVLGALIDLGLPVEKLKKELKKLPFPSWTIEAFREKRHSLSGVNVKIRIKNCKGLSLSLKEIDRTIKTSSLSSNVKTMSRAIFRRVAEAEARVHGEVLKDVHFHEIGAIDSIIDIVGASIGIEYLGIQEICSSPLPFNRGFIRCQHGTLPCPGPATLELLKGVPVYGAAVEKELVTPTGAAILTTLCRSYSTIPSLRLEKIGYGAGSLDLKEVPNLLRIILGEKEDSCAEDRAIVIEANIDDMNPEFFDYLMERLFEKGALDVSLSSLQMKKNRPGVLLKVITSPDTFDQVKEIIFMESTTAGIRFYEVKRIKLKRLGEEIKTPFGKVRVKIIKGYDGRTFFHPEYDDLKKIARKKNISLREADQFLQNIFIKSKVRKA
jgi:hypothetical protein